MTKEIVMRLLLASLLLAPALAYAVVYEWVDPQSKAKHMEGNMPECYANPAPGCPRIKVYQDGHLIDDNGSKARDAAAVHRATLEEREAALARLRSRQIESNRVAQQAKADAQQAANESYQEKQRQVREGIKAKSKQFRANPFDRETYRQNTNPFDLGTYRQNTNPFDRETYRQNTSPFDLETYRQNTNPFDRETYRQSTNPFERDTYRQGPGQYNR